MVLAKLLRHCVLCGARGRYWCATCRPLALTAHTPGGLEVLCLGPYEGRLADQIKQLKYAQQTVHARPLGSALGECAQGSRQFSRLTRGAPGAERICLVPIPLHPARLAERGFNQAALVARAAARGPNLKVDFDLLSRIRSTPRQAQLGREERLKNVTGAFLAQPPGRARPNTHYVLIDDVFTTGTTLDSAAQALWTSGVPVNLALCLARKS